MTENKELSKSIEVLKIALQADKSNGSYYHSWQANIAMCIYDEMNKEESIPDSAKAAIANMCNNAAKRFLELLINNNKA